MVIGRTDYPSTLFFEKFSAISVAVQCPKWLNVSRPEGKKSFSSHKSIPFLINFYFHFEDHVAFDNVPLASVSIEIFGFFSTAS